MDKTILITGGVGFLGSCVAYLLAKQGYKVVIVDNLVYGQSSAHTWATFIKADFSDRQMLSSLFKQYAIDLVIHCALFSDRRQDVDSVQQLYQNNVSKTLELLDMMREYNVKYFIFSSSAAVYGAPSLVPISENCLKDPISPDGKSRLFIERVLEDYAKAYDFYYVALRHFSLAGSVPEVGLGPCQGSSAHLVLQLLRAAYLEEPFTLFGDDYQTKDGTCVRDYVHVLDVASAYLSTIEHLYNTQVCDCFNLGSGNGFTVREMKQAVEKISGKRVIVKVAKKRACDPPALIADYSKALHILHWQPRFSSLNFIVQSALKWEMDNNFQATNPAYRVS